MGNTALEAALNAQFLVQIGVFTAVPMIMGFILELGLLKVSPYCQITSHIFYYLKKRSFLIFFLTSLLFLVTLVLDLIRNINSCWRICYFISSDISVYYFPLLIGSDIQNALP